MSRITAGARWYITGALRLQRLRCLSRLLERVVPLSERCSTYARAHRELHCRSVVINHRSAAAPEATLPKRGPTSLERCGSRSFIAGAWSYIAGALWLQNLHCRSLVLHCRSAVAPEALLPEHGPTSPECVVRALSQTVGAPSEIARVPWYNNTLPEHVVTLLERVVTMPKRVVTLPERVVLHQIYVQLP
ncbi:hypothetical protein AMTR_s00114p00090620 [Amborella trichopoda]|uniref:Uncharacterized protein n=1 Tax=Amborella trichopoda TaxID=13333 RepID=W1NW53_AMBTC|nr:hypothetical protein AMTR_s00114p00090620 [Amborella trichopoda]